MPILIKKFWLTQRGLFLTGWTEEDGLEPWGGSRPSAHLSLRCRAGSGTFRTRSPNLAGGCQGFTGPEPSTLLDELHGHHATALIYEQFY